MSDAHHEMPPGITPGALPPFHLLDEYAFQELCRDLMDLEPGVAYCEVYGRRGQGQRGIDLLAPRQHNDGLEVGQCKRYADFRPKDITAASDEFFAHWDYWQGHRVRRFILFVACDLTERKRQDEVGVQRARFAEHEIDYEVWSAATLRNRLRPHPGIVATYCTPRDYWLEAICGMPRSPATSAGGQGGVNAVVSGAMVGLVERLSGRLAEATQGRLDVLREAWREGRRQEAEEGIRALRSDTGVWDTLAPEVRAKVIRLEAALALGAPGGLGRARQLATKALALEPGASGRRLDAMLVRYEAGPETALDVLGAVFDEDDRHLAAAFLLEAGRIEEARALLDFATAGLTATAETYRLRALASLAVRDLDGARLASLKALELAPRWDSVRFVAASIDYLGALSPAAVPDSVSEWPVPVEWVYVKRDEESVAKLRAAEREFSALASGDGRTRDEIRGYQTWKLACLANDSGRQEEAVAYCRELLASDSTHPGAFAWAVARRFEVDFNAMEDALRGSLRGDDDVQLVLSLAGYYLAVGRAADAEALLRDSRTRFEAQDQVELWTFWYVQSRIGQRDPAGALAILDEVPGTPGLQRLRSLALRAQAELTGAWEDVVSELDRQYQETRDPALLFETCSALANAEQWAKIADRAELLVEAVATADVVRLAAQAAYRAERVELCLKLLDDNRHLFGEGKLPHNLRSLRVALLRRLGGLSAAAMEAEALAREEPTLSNLLGLAQLRYDKGDLKGLVAVARAIADREDLTPSIALQLARGVVAEDTVLAKLLWRRAMDGGVADSDVRSAVELGHRLGLDAQMDALMERFFELGRQGREGIFMGRLEDLPRVRVRHGDRVERLNEAYRAGGAPIHLIAGELNVELDDLYHRRLRDNELAPDPVRQFALFARHGLRAAAVPLPEEDRRRRLHLDITALLLAAHVEILDLVEAEFSPLWIPAEVIPALIRMRQELLPVQATQVEVCREVLDLHGAGALRMVPDQPPGPSGSLPWADQIGRERAVLLVWAQTESGYVLDYLPIRSGVGDPPELPEEVQARFVDDRAVVESLWRHGPLSEPEYTQALHALRVDADAPLLAAVPEPGAMLYCHANTAEWLAHLGLLRTAGERFRLGISGGSLERVRAVLATYERQSTEAAWLGTLIERLRQGVDQETYRVIPAVADGPEGEKEEDEDGRSDDMDGLRTLLSFEAQPGDVVWVDDRFGTGYWSRGGVPVFGIVEVLEMLVERGRLDRSGGYEVLAKLRASNVRFLAPTPEEVLHHLARSRVEAGRLVETRELAVLRRYLAACLLDGEVLQRPFLPDGTPNDKTEIAFLVALDRTSVGVLVEVWADPHADDDTRRARADWVLDSLLVDFAAMRRVAKLTRPFDDERAMVAATLASMVVHAFGADWPDGAEGSVRDDYLAWLDGRVLQPRFEAEPLLAPTIAQIVRHTLLTVPGGEFADVPEVIRTAALQIIYDALPERIQEELGKDDALLERLEMEAVPTVVLDGSHFRRDEFRLAVAEAVNGRKARIRSAGPEGEFLFDSLPRDKGRAAFRVQNVAAGSSFTVRDDFLLLLSESPSEREACLRANRHWYDSHPEGFEGWVAKLASTDDPVARMEIAEAWRDSSAMYFYVRLPERLGHGQRFRVDELLPPSGDRFLGHFRLSPDLGDGDAFRDALASAAGALVGEDDLSVAIERWAGLPVLLPAPVTEAVQALGTIERRALVKALLRQARSPVADLHLLQLLWTLGDDEPVYRRLAECRAARLFSEEHATRFAAFQAILRWTAERFARWPDAQSWTAPTRLGAEWLHAHRIFVAFAAVGAHLDKVAEIFRGLPTGLALRFTQADLSYELDISQSRRLERLPFLVFGLSYACGVDHGRMPAESLRRIVRAATLKEATEGLRLPALPLFRDTGQAGNVMASWLGGISSKAASALLGEGGEWLAADAREKLASGALDQIAVSACNFTAWTFLRAVVKDLPPRPPLGERIMDVALGLDYVALVRADPVSGTETVRSLAMQARYIADEVVVLRIRTALVEVAAALADLYRDRMPVPRGELFSGGEIGRVAVSLLESTIDVALAVESADDRVAILTLILEDLLGAWPALASMIFVIVQRLQDNLPVARSVLLSHLLVRLRTEPSIRL